MDNADPQCGDVFRVISNPVRRRVLEHLDREGPETLGAVATCVAVDPTSLYHAHVPKLVDANCVRCTDAQDVNDRVLSITGVGETAVVLLNAAPDCFNC